MNRTTLVLVGGFLGAGKTSLILAAARLLEQRGIRTAAILNDQGGALVDTQLTMEHHIPAEQVTGGCFCCRYDDLARSISSLQAHNPEVIFAEPVGSCTDIAATVLRPLQSQTQLHIAPFTVLRDPSATIQSEDPDIAYLYAKQLEEADLIRTTKADLYPEAELSARTGQGIAEWLQEVLAGTTTAGSRLLDIDYTRYARAEAALGWLNCEATLKTTPTPPASIAGPILDHILQSRIHIAHVKLIVTAQTGYIKAALTSNQQEPDVEGDLTASPATQHQLRLNLRALNDPQHLREIVEATLKSIPGQWRSMTIDSFRPAPPTRNI
ncbi:MAG: GTP-binding protein [Bryobacteraceae bacterium]